MGNMLESSSASNVMQMGQKGDQPNENQNQSDSNQQKNNTQTKENFLGNMMQGPSNQELDVSITGENIIQLAGVTAAICIVSIAVPAAYVLRLTPRQIYLERKVKMEKLLEQILERNIKRASKRHQTKRFILPICLKKVKSMQLLVRVEAGKQQLFLLHLV